MGKHGEQEGFNYTSWRFVIAGVGWIGGPSERLMTSSGIGIHLSYYGVHTTPFNLMFFRGIRRRDGGVNSIQEMSVSTSQDFQEKTTITAFLLQEELLQLTKKNTTFLLSNATITFAIYCKDTEQVAKCVSYLQELFTINFFV